jgi:glycosyltransferase involved in cell wall biosynthesis
LKIALDATYSLGDALSGVGVYSREILYGLATSEPDISWEWFYRSQRYWRARLHTRLPVNVKCRFLADSWGSRSASILHGLNQRLPRRRFRRQVATFHDLFVLSGDYSTPEFRTRFAAQAREAAAGAEVIIAVSAFTGKQVETYLNVPATRIRVVHHGVLPREIPDLPKEKVVLCVGAIQRRKNQAGLVRAFRAMPQDWTLVLAGSSGYGSEETFQEIGTSPCAGRIHVTGYLPDAEIAAWYARASIFAFPSLDEGFGMPVLEAMAAGLPVITSDQSALPEVSGDAAILVNPANESDIGDALKTLARDESRRASMAALGRAHAATFRWPNTVKATARIYREIA